mmetsp:Transcript_61467/g.121603  ORF Transcript_61467/g.121603 Transcript_61467/m.121603 type:complete len:108 (-) Transcript_61467:176-499(-)
MHLLWSCVCCDDTLMVWSARWIRREPRCQLVDESIASLLVLPPACTPYRRELTREGGARRIYLHLTDWSIDGVTSSFAANSTITAATGASAAAASPAHSVVRRLGHR